jgi:hypothetical protein
MATENFATFKYDHGDALTSPGGAATRWLSYLALVALFTVFLGISGIVVAFIGAIVLFAIWPKRRLCLGARYLLCGNTVVYYANVRKMVLRPGQDLVLAWADGSFMLQLDKFPTNARKDAKIRKNKAAKFEKVSNGIIRRVLLASPTVETSGINRVQVVKKGAP